MKKTIMTITLACFSMIAHATSSIDNKTLDLIIQRLESTGKLEEALNKIIIKKIESEKNAQANAQLVQEKKNQENANAIPGFSDKEHYLGNPNANYSIIVYEDMECQFCKVYAEVPENVIKKLQDVNFVSRANPLHFHMPMAAKQAVLAECVAEELGNEGYFNFKKSIFKSTLTNGQGLPPLPLDYEINGSNAEKNIFKDLKNIEKTLFAVAKNIGIKDIEKTLSCYKDIKTSKKLQTLLQTSANYGITGTPTTIFKNNKTGEGKMIPGIMTEEELIEKFNQFINK